MSKFTQIRASDSYRNKQKTDAPDRIEQGKKEYEKTIIIIIIIIIERSIVNKFYQCCGAKGKCRHTIGSKGQYNV